MIQILQEIFYGAWKELRFLHVVLSSGPPFLSSGLPFLWFRTTNFWFRSTTLVPSSWFLFIYNH